VNATILDMVRWAQAQLGGFPDVLPESLLEMQHTPIVETPHGNYFNRWPRLDKAWYGLGWRIMDYAGLRVVHHGGGVRGYRSEMVLIPEHNIGLVVLFNASTPLANDVVPKFLDELLLVLAR
jgi:beta-lactamase class C